ncbi:MAG TPA: trypsin-like peptidase domain-containing protein [Herpetosiphonaceae bacterium]
MESPKKQLSIGALVVIALILAGLGGGLVGGVAGYQLASGGQAAPAEPTSPGTPVASPEQPSTTPSEPVVSGSFSDEIVATVDKTAPAVVTVVNTITPAQRATGSGVIISEDGYLITNNHVVEGQSRLQVIYADGSYHEAELVGTDEFADIAVLRVKDPVPAVAAIGDSDALKPGETVIAIGSPLGEFQNSITVGVVSALNRTVEGSGMEGLIQTDAAINHGNSGGPLINLKGEVVGINTLVVRGDASGGSLDVAQGLGFSVPSNIVREVSDALIANGQVERPYLGVEARSLTPEDALNGVSADRGALILSVQEGAAQRAGLQRGDIITKINEDEITPSMSLRRLLLKYQPNDTITLTVQRDGREQQVQVTLGTRPSGDQLRTSK